MKLYKFRPLAEEKDFQRAKSIIETGRFWCSRFSELNDPMEGVFYAQKENIDIIYSEKNKYKICSFSGEKAFENLTMWGYYANGFKGIVIEIEVDSKNVKEMAYLKNIPRLESSTNNNTIEKILTSKLKPWEHEAEYRFLKKSENNFYKIGKITAVYFGEPYRDIANKEPIYEENIKLQCYQCLRNKLITIAQDKIKCFSVRIKNSKVEKDVEIKSDSTA